MHRDAASRSASKASAAPGACGLTTHSRARLRRALAAAALGLGCSFFTEPALALLWPSEAARLSRDLTAKDVAVRRRAAARITELPDALLGRSVIAALNDVDLEVRLLAALAGKRGGVPGLAARLVGWLTESDARLRLAAAEALALEPSPRAVGALSRALSDIEPQVRAAAASALAASAAPEAVIGLLGRLDDPAVEVKEAVVRALARLGDPRAVVPLISKVEDPRPTVRRAVVRALGELGDRRAVSALVLALRDNDAGVRAAALDALGELGDASATASVGSVLTSEASAQVRVAAIHALSRLATPEAVARLVEALGVLAEERDVIERALGGIGAPATAALTACLAGGERSERADGCARALAFTRAPGAALAIREATRRGRVAAEAALEALAELRDPEAVSLALEHLLHRDPAVRRAALLAARALLDPRRTDGRAVEPLELAFQRARGQRLERLELLRLLGRTGADRAARTLIPIAESADDLDFRLVALEALGSLNSREAPAALVKALDDSEPAVRLAGALSIRRSGPEGLARELLDRLERAGSQDRSAVALALTGAVARAGDETVRRLARALAAANGGERDALIEALAHARSRSALDRLTELAASPDPADRRKIAEGLALREDARGTLVSLARDPDAAVRASALWALGAIGTAAEREVLERALVDADVAVAANAAAALGRLGKRANQSVEAPLCRALSDRRSAVRANALSALRGVGRRCGDGRDRALVALDASSRVRLAAAELVRDVARTADDEKLLRRCAREEPTGTVAAACSSLSQPPAVGSREILVFVVPAGEASPVSGATFALARPDGLVRHGVSDRRGALCEAEVPEGELALAVPAALEE